MSVKCPEFNRRCPKCNKELLITVGLRNLKIKVSELDAQTVCMVNQFMTCGLRDTV